MKRFFILLVLLCSFRSMHAQTIGDRCDANVILNDAAVTSKTGGHSIHPPDVGYGIDSAYNLIKALYLTAAAGGTLQTVTTAGNTTDQGVYVAPLVITPPMLVKVGFTPSMQLQWFYTTDGFRIFATTIQPSVPAGPSSSTNQHYFTPDEPAGGSAADNTFVTHKTKDVIEVISGTDISYLGRGYVQSGHAGSEGSFLGWRDKFVTTGGGGAGYDVINTMLSMKDKTNPYESTILPPNGVLTGERFLWLPDDTGYIAIIDDTINGRGMYPRIVPLSYLVANYYTITQVKQAIDDSITSLLTRAVTLTNKRITARDSTATSISTAVTYNTDLYDRATLTAQAANINFILSGTPTKGQIFVIEIWDNGTARSLTFDAAIIFGSSAPAPTTTAGSVTKPLTIELMCLKDGKFHCQGVNAE